MRKILFGIPAMQSFGLTDDDGFIIDKEVKDDMDVWCDFAVVDTMSVKGIVFEFETFLHWDKPDGCTNWIKFCFDKFTEYMESHELDTGNVLNMYDVFTEGYNCNSNFGSVEHAYAWMKFVVEGFKGDAI